MVFTSLYFDSEPVGGRVEMKNGEFGIGVGTVTKEQNEKNNGNGSLEVFIARYARSRLGFVGERKIDPRLNVGVKPKYL
jgi:hypothetical protein